MEFAVCPACGQSVLDDDEENCPFCGASMKAKSGAKPAPGKAGAAAPPKPTAKPAPKAVAKGAADDLPFGLDTAASTSAIAASRQPGKGRTLRVVCPMCETEGYVPETAAGKEVRCANPKCLVPTFVAPEPEPEPVAPPPKKKGNPVLLGVVTTLVVGAIGGAVWFVAGQPEDDGVHVKPVDITNLTKPRPSGAATPTVAQPDPNPTPAADLEKPATAAPTTDDFRAIVAAALKACEQACLLTGNRNRSKPVCRRLTAEAFALSGEVSGAREQIQQLAAVGSQLPFYQVIPFVEIFWQEHRQGNSRTADEALDQALAAAEKLPIRGRDQLDVATRLAQALVVAGRLDAARTLIAAHQATDLDAEVSAQFLWLAADRNGGQIDWLFRKRPVTARQFPQAAAVAAICVLGGDADRGREFATGWSDPNVQTECLTTWGEAMVWTAPGQAVAALEPLVTNLPPAAQAMAWARAARVALVKQSPEVARQSLAKGQAAIANLTPPENYLIPDTKALVKTRPTFEAEWVAAAAAAGELAVAEFEAGGDPEAVVKSLELSLQFARGLGPAMPAIADQVATANRLGLKGLTSQVKTELALRTDDEARQMAGVFRRALTDLETAAQTRFQLQTTILTRAAQQGLDAAVWRIVAGLSAAEDPAVQERFLATEVAPWLVEHFRAAGNAADEKTLVAACTAAGLPALKRPVEAVFEEQIAAGKYAEAWKTVSDRDVRSDVREALVIYGAVRQAQTADPVEKTWQLIGPVIDVVLREQAIEWAAWMAARRGAAEEVWGHYKDLSSATEIVSLGRGVTAGVQDRLATSEKP